MEIVLMVINVVQATIHLQLHLLVNNVVLYVLIVQEELPMIVLVAHQDLF